LKKPVHNPREVAEIVAVQALGFIAGDPERLGLFLAESGIGPETLRTAAANPQFLASVLDFNHRNVSFNTYPVPDVTGVPCVN